MQGDRKIGGSTYLARRVDAGTGGLSERRRQIRVTLAGSLRRFKARFDEARNLFARENVNVLSPLPGVEDSVDRGYMVLESDPSRDPRITEGRHLDAVTNSDLIWVMLPDDTPGISTTMEIGYAIAKGVPVFTSDTISDRTLSAFVKRVSSPREALLRVQGRREQGRTTVLLSPKEAITEIRYRVDELERLLLTGSGQMAARDSRRASDAGLQVRSILGVLGHLAG